jgi:hypothetical protein
MKFENLLLVAGSGRNSGKTTIICKIINQFRHLGITSIKISPHFHNLSDGLVLFSERSGFAIYEETSRDSSKDSSRMLQSGAEKVYYIQATEVSVNEAFSEVYSSIAPGKAIICESPALINYIEPGLFILMISPATGNLKNTEELKKFPYTEFTYKEIIKKTLLPIGFADGVWKSLK